MLNFHCSTTDKKLVKLGDKVVGCLEGSKFIKFVIASRHKLRYPPAWAIDADIFDTEIKPNCINIVVIDKETGTKYHASVSTFDKMKGELDRGFGRQYFLTLNNWQVEHNGNRQLTLWGDDGNGQKQ
jgi:hypothetical protein